jgi:DoxX-like family
MNAATTGNHTAAAVAAVRDEEFFMERQSEEKRMPSATETAPGAKKKLWAARLMSGLAVLFLLLDGAMKVMKAAVVVEGSLQLGYPESTIVGIGAVLLVCTILYAIPRTSVLGAILLTGYLGGAVATHVRVGNPLFSHVLFPVYLGILIWGALVLRDSRLRGLLPVTK